MSQVTRSARQYITRTSCEGAHGQAAGICRNAGRHCRGTWPGFVRATKENP